MAKEKAMQSNSMFSCHQSFLTPEAIPELGKEKVLLMAEDFGKSSFLYLKWFTDTKRARGRKMFFTSYGRFLTSEFLTGGVCLYPTNYYRKNKQTKMRTKNKIKQIKTNRAKQKKEGMETGSGIKD